MLEIHFQFLPERGGRVASEKDPSKYGPFPLADVKGVLSASIFCILRSRCRVEGVFLVELEFIKDKFGRLCWEMNLYETAIKYTTIVCEILTMGKYKLIGSLI